MTGSYEKIKQIIVDELGVDEDEVTTDARFNEDLGADALDFVEMIMRFEEEFDVEIPDETAEKLLRVGDVFLYLTNTYVDFEHVDFEDDELIQDRNYLKK